MFSTFEDIYAKIGECTNIGELKSLRPLIDKANNWTLSYRDKAILQMYITARINELVFGSIYELMHKNSQTEEEILEEEWSKDREEAESGKVLEIEFVLDEDDED